MNFSFVDNRINDIPDFDFIHSCLDTARLWFGKDVYVLTYDLSRDVGMMNVKVMKGVVKDYINLTEDGNSVRMDMAVDIEGRLTIPCSILTSLIQKNKQNVLLAFLPRWEKEFLHTKRKCHYE